MSGSPVRYSLAAGQRTPEGFIGVDKAPTAAIQADLLVFPWTFAEPGSADELVCEHFIEHIPLTETPEGQDLFFAFFDACWDLLKEGGTMRVVAPYYNNMRAWQDPTHRRAITDATFLYLNRSWRQSQGLDHYTVKCNFEFTTAHGMSNPRWANAHPETRDFAVRHYTNTVDDIHAVLTKRE